MKFKGSVTVFLALILVFVMGVVGSLLESARVNVAREIAVDDGYLAMQNILAEYQRELWNDYHVFFVDESALEGDEGIAKKANRYLQEMVEEGQKNFMGTTAKFVNMGMNESMVEGNCKYFVKQASQYMKYRGMKDLAGSVIQGEKAESLGKGQETLKKSLKAKIEAEKKLLEAEKAKEKGKEIITNKEIGKEDVKKGEADSEAEKARKKSEKKKEKKAKKKLKEYEKALKNGIDGVEEGGFWLNLLGGGGVKISKKTIRETKWKNYGEDGGENVGIVDKGLLLLYVKDHFENFLSWEDGENKRDRNKEVLDYGMEYIAIGKESDKANITAMVERIFGIRTTVWYSYFWTRADKVAEAAEIATAAVGILGPAAVSIAQMGIMMAWATGEARSDVKTLLEGGEIKAYPATDAVKMKYENFLDMFLTLSISSMPKRIVKLIEQNMMYRYHKEFRADNCFSGVYGDMEGKVEPRIFHLRFMKKQIGKKIDFWGFQYFMSESLCR